MLEPSAFMIGIGLATLAGLATVLGGLLVIVFGPPSSTTLSFELGLSAGVLLLVSFVELLANAIVEVGFSPAMIAFFVGIGVLFFVDALLPHEFMEEHDSRGFHVKRLKRLGLLTTLGVAIHNFPEGLAVFAGALASTELGLALAITIAIHNIPEGVVVALPVYVSTGSRLRALLYSLASGAAEPIGALLGALVLSRFLVGDTLPFLLAFVAGFMAFISLDELLPAAHRYAHEHVVILGIVTGLAIAALGLAFING